MRDLLKQRHEIYFGHWLLLILLISATYGAMWGMIINTPNPLPWGEVADDGAQVPGA